MISVVLADDQALVHGALKVLLKPEGDLEAVGEAGIDEELLATVARVIPAIATADIEMPDLDGTGATARICAAHPQTRALILTTFGRPSYLCRALEAGASGFTVKDTPSQELARAVRETAAGGRVTDPKLAAESLFEGENPLTPHEQEVLYEVKVGHHIATIAKTIYLPLGTVRNYLSSVISKIHADTSAGAARYARDQGRLQYLCHTIYSHSKHRVFSVKWLLDFEGVAGF